MPRSPGTIASNLLLVSAVVMAISLPARGGISASGAETGDRAAAQAAADGPRSRPKRPAPKKTYEEYQVAAGTYLPIELRTALSSNSNRPSDHVEGRLLRPLTADGVEVVPAGAVVLGTISHVESATVKERGRLAFSFHVIEHPQTGSRATIRTTVLSFESDPPQRRKPLPELKLEKGRDASVALLAPLLVRLPKTTTNY